VMDSLQPLPRHRMQTVAVLCAHNASYSPGFLGAWLGGLGAVAESESAGLAERIRARRAAGAYARDEPNCPPVSKLPHGEQPASIEPLPPPSRPSTVTCDGRFVWLDCCSSVEMGHEERSPFEYFASRVDGRHRLGARKQPGAISRLPVRRQVQTDAWRRHDMTPKDLDHGL